MHLSCNNNHTCHRIAEAFRVPFNLLSISDINPKFREFVVANFDDIGCVYATMKAQAEERRPLQISCDSRLTGDGRFTQTNFEDGVLGGSLPERFGSPPEVDWAVFGTPCPPFSSQRAKRKADGTKAHYQHDITFRDSIEWLQHFEPKCGTVEQVVGFTKSESSSDGESPLERPCFCCRVALRLFVCCSRRRRQPVLNLTLLIRAFPSVREFLLPANAL